ncbi:hypothetical protein [Candidatus Colwellia aromaticivorans]|uniref:hypothetical protein n=1 Tax=Candidatus Colwellia aromaticivorans TaxID=2267621 RepID=UPI000DF174C4|nr:hypothetical protein [Candidatus Colwellia aromaticivorans]
MKKKLLASTLLTMTLLLPALSFAQEKHHDDPTKIVTKLGVGYNDGLTFSGSIGLDEVRMINASIDEDASEWRIGGSWLFDIGIVNFNFSRVDYENDVYKNNYSVGTFIPLSIFGFTPGGWQIFPMAGYNYNDGNQLTEKNAPTLSISNFNAGDFVLIPSSSHGAYLGAFGLKPLTENFSLIALAGGMAGSNSYSGYWAGGGLSYKINNQQSFGIFGIISDDDYGQRNDIAISYSYQFN